MRQQTIVLLRMLAAVAGMALALPAGATRAESTGTPAIAADPTFSSRTEKSDGSAAMTIGRRLPTEWETKIGTDISLAGPVGSSPSENLLRGGPPDRSSGAIWGSLTMPGLAPQVWDKTSLEARIDAGSEQGKFGATLSRSVPIGRNLSVTLQNTYSVTHALADNQPAATVVPLMTYPLPATPAESTSTWTAGQSVRLNIESLGTALLASGTATSADEQWHNKLSVEQSLFGPLKLTTSVEDAGTAASKKTVTASFKRVW